MYYYSSFIDTQGRAAGQGRVFCFAGLKQSIADLWHKMYSMVAIFVAVFLFRMTRDIVVIFCKFVTLNRVYNFSLGLE